MTSGFGPQLLLLVLGWLVLYLGAEGLVRGSIRIAESLGVSRLAIGLTIVAFGTSAPELATGITGALTGNEQIVVGNVVGANIADISLVLGVGTVMRATPVIVSGVRHETLFLVGAYLLFYVLVLDRAFGRLEGILFVSAIVLYTWWKLRRARGGAEPQDESSGASLLASHGRGLPVLLSSLLVAGSAIMLAAGARLMVNSATTLASAFGVSQGVIGLSLVALGTTLPEMATTIVGTIRHEYNIVVGDLVGSCVFNLLAILGIAAVINPLEIEPAWLIVEIPVMIAFGLVLLFLAMRKAGHILRWQGALLLLAYFAFIAWIFR